ncbi:MAG: hypothetical protein ACRD1K_12850, partial [Acidimicrobiales bacterium]
MTGLVSPDIRPDHWIYVGWLLVVYGTISLALALIGTHDDLTNPVRIFFRRISNALRQGTGYPGWSMAGALSGLAMLGTAAMGLYWDVAWHIDLGRDRELFTPSHVMILIGLGGLIFAAFITAVFATNDEADVGMRIGSARIPWSAVSLGALGIGGLAAFPFDVLWHEAYGIDITLWSPSHLMLVGGGGLATVSLWLMMAEARRHAEPTWIGKGIEGFIVGTVLVGVSAFQGEFDFGVPQFQVLYWPLLVVIAAGLTLVTARIGLGRGGALAAVAGFLVVRGIIAVLVGVSLNHTVPRFPLYLGAALAVEAVALWLGTDNRVRFAIAAGLGIATFGLGAELVWADASGWFTPTGASLFTKVAVLAPLAAIAAALLGAGLSRAFGGERVPGWMLGAAGAVLVAVLAFPLPRNVGDVEAVIRLRPADSGLAADAAGDGGVKQATVEIDLQPPDAARGAVAFGVTSWQGGGRLSAALEETAPGRYVASRPLPIGGDWKTTVGLFRGDQVMAAPVYLPADESIGASEIPAVAERRTRFVRNTTLLLREVS